MPFLSYLQAGTRMVGMSMNTMEEGATIIGSEGFTLLGSKGGIFPELSIESTWPFKSIVWLCISPWFGVRWYSSLIVKPNLSIGNLPFLWCGNCSITVLFNMAFATERPTCTVASPSRLIRRTVIPGCISEISELKNRNLMGGRRSMQKASTGILYFIEIVDRKLDIVRTYRSFWAVSISS